MDIKVVISIKYGWSTIVWAKIRHLRHFVQSLLGVKVHTSCKISKFCRLFGATKTHVDKIFGICFFFTSKDKIIDISRKKIKLGSYHLDTLKKNNFMAPFYGWGSTASRLQPLRGGSLLFTTKFPEVSGTHFIDLGRMKG